jgi:hypothetical protein
MSCQHTQTTTLLWLYGEGPQDHAAHVAGCASCQAVVRDHEQVASALGPALASVSAPPRSSGRRRPPWAAGAVVAGLVALAAGLLLWARPPEATPPAPVRVVVTSPSSDPLDMALDDLDLELERLSLDLETL